MCFYIKQWFTLVRRTGIVYTVGVRDYNWLVRLFSGSLQGRTTIHEISFNSDVTYSQIQLFTNLRIDWRLYRLKSWIVFSAFSFLSNLQRSCQCLCYIQPKFSKPSSLKFFEFGLYSTAFQLFSLRPYVCPQSSLNDSVSHVLYRFFNVKILAFIAQLRLLLPS